MDRKKRSDNKRMYVLILTAMAAGAAMFVMTNTGTGHEYGITNRPWKDIKPIIMSRIGEDYEAVGQCTGYVYWCFAEAYGVDWGTNSYVEELEEKLKSTGVSKVDEGRNGKITDDMRPGDIVIFLDGRKRTHCAILGEKGHLYQAISSGVDRSMTLHEWMALPKEQRNCDRYVIYRGVL